MNKDDKARDKRGRTKTEAEQARKEEKKRIESERESIERNRAQVAEFAGDKKSKGALKQIKLRKEDKNHDEPGIYDKVSMADLAWNVYKKAKKNQSKLDTVHVSGISESATVPIIEKVKKGREGDKETILSPTQEPEFFKDVHDSPWGKSAQKMGDRFGKNIGRVTVADIHKAPDEASWSGHELKFDLTDQSNEQNN
ncbi:unnamed protein product [Clonostachys rosea]|uniref:Uncharacterized protein n=1 Tax=Bionectria ochroleuca TaxID=29856 RepID=A0ABY6TQY9_BIOOC|nr:unnamed protein product [Clonostachys rosea]